MNAITGLTDNRREAEHEIPSEDIFEVLSNRRRRFVIHAIKHADEPPDVSELSRYVTAWELDIDVEEVPYEYRHNVHSTLKRTHLPKLTENDIVTVDEDGVVRPAAGLEHIEVYVEVLRGREIPWNTYYLGLSALSIALLLGVAVGVPGFGGFTPLAVGVFTATAFGISAAAHHAIGRRTRLGTTEKPPAAYRKR